MEKLGDYKIYLRVKEVKGKCPAGYNAGDVIEIEDVFVKKGKVCLTAIAALYPKIFGMRYGCAMPWGKDENSVLVPCPEYENTVIFEIRRVKRE